ncbi:hypothetical protein NIES4074_02780 [Cylindrospermum sp. NIES-4074]|nr:hypothetical protein NIES4074_02780 [Cylindrospermum sp. NIES-4074]
MFVVVASRHDEAAQALVTNWAADGASLLTSKDLSSVGWRHYLSATQDSTAVVGEQVVRVEEITGVLTRLPCVSEQELVHIARQDRAYVAAEMNAFLISWLSGLKCPVLNRPTPTYLLGPAWRPEQWVYAAAQIGIPVRPVQRRTPVLANVSPQVLDAPPVSVTVVGKRCFGDVEAALTHHARRLADAAQVDLLTVRFSSSDSQADFVGAELWADISIPDIADAILEYLSGGDAKC